jgi:outer membrane autotransporter protein
VAQTPNQLAVASALDARPLSDPLALAVLNQTAMGARQAFDALSGEVHASAVSNAFEDARLPREAILGRLAEPIGASVPAVPPGPYAAIYTKSRPPVPDSGVYTSWGQAFGAFGRIGGNGNAASADRSLGGLVTGIDTSFDARWRIGLAAGYTQSFMTVRDRGSSGSVESGFGGVYAGGAFGNIRLRGGGLMSQNEYDLSRSVAFPGFIDKTNSRSGGYTAQVFGEAGYFLGFGLASFEPFVGALAMHIGTNRFSETGGLAALNGASLGYDYQATKVGVRAETSLSKFGATGFSAHGVLAWQHVFGDVTPTSLLAFTTSPLNTFTISGAPIARDALVTEAGLDWRIKPNVIVGVFYSGSIGNKTYDNGINGKFEVKF